jgi:hypothetical protein
MSQESKKIVYDGIISLGSFCQMGAALWMYELKNINSPLDNFGIKSWSQIATILKNRFEDYWLLENMGMGKQIFELANKYNQKRDIIKAYDNKYNLVSNHNFLVEEGNSTEELVTYPIFRKKLRRIEEIFFKQCEIYENVRFVIKALNWPEEYDTEVKPEQIVELIEVLRELRQGKKFDLVMAVPIKLYDSLQAWATTVNIPELRLTSWSISFNNEKHTEWDAMLGDAELSPHYFYQLMNEIIGDPDASIHEIVGF